MEALERVRQAVNEVLFAQGDKALAAEGWVHLYGVSQAAALLAAKRGLDAELCAAAGMLHDIYTYHTGLETDHALLGAPEALAILNAAGGFEQGRALAVERMILRHSDKKAVDGPLEECLKDADVLAHWLYDPMKKFNEAKKSRLLRIFEELGLKGEVQEE